MIDLEQTLHRSLTTLAESQPVTTPPVAWVREAATSDGERPRRPRRVLVAAVAGGLTLGVGGAALAGVLPGSVTDAFHRMSDWGGPCRIDKSDAHLVASTRTRDGSTLQWWASSTAQSDHIDQYFRVVGPDGRAHGGGSSCGPRATTPAKFEYVGGSNNATEIDVWGQAPIGTSTLSVDLSDGSTVALSLQADRYFMSAFGAARHAPHPVTVVARAADGSVIATTPVGF